MSSRDLKETYGRNLKTSEAINRAIRAELVGGDACLDALANLHVLTRKLRGRNLPGCEWAQEALDLTRTVANAMEAEIRKRYGIGG